MKLLTQGILLFALLSACQKQEIASKEPAKEYINASTVKASAYGQSKMPEGLFNSYNWEQQVPLKRHDTVIAIKVMRLGNTSEKVSYLLVHNSKNGWGDIVLHEITYAIKDGKALPQSIASTSIISKKTGTKKLVPTIDGVQTGRSGTGKKSLVSPGGTLPMVTIYGYYQDGAVINTQATDYFLISGGLNAASGGGSDGNIWNDPSIYCDMLDPMYTPDAGTTAGLQPNYSLEDTRWVNGIIYTRDNYPYKAVGYPWLWWENNISNNNNGDEWVFSGDDGTFFTDYVSTREVDFQFDSNDNYETQYPRFTNLVKNLKTFVKDNPDVLNALQRYSGFSKQKIIDHLSYGSGPIIKVEEMTGRFSYYNSKNSRNTLHIRASYVRGLEQSYFQSTKKATSFLLAVCILHEYVHYGTTINNIDEGKYDFGLGFERDASNVYVNELNAGEIVISFDPYF